MAARGPPEEWLKGEGEGGKIDKMKIKILKKERGEIVKTGEKKRAKRKTKKMGYRDRVQNCPKLASTRWKLKWVG